MEKDFRKLLEFWRSIYLRKGHKEVSDDRKENAFRSTGSEKQDITPIQINRKK